MFTKKNGTEFQKWRTITSYCFYIPNNREYLLILVLFIIEYQCSVCIYSYINFQLLPMDDCCSKTYNNGLVDSSSYIICGSDSLVKNNNGKGKTELSSSHPLDGNIKTNKIDETCVKVSALKPMTSTLKKPVAILKSRAVDAKIATPIKVSLEPYCPLKLDSIKQLKDSTKKLLCLLEDIQTKTNFKGFPIADTTEIRLAQIAAEDTKEPVNTDESDEALKKLEAKTKALNTIYLEDEDDDCSIFKRLTRKCNCLNQLEYNDFIIHFNENTKYFTSTTGEIIKNMRILKKFLYMGSKYTKNALIFLNEGLADSGYAEKVEITQGCSHSDMCNVFEDNSIVTTCISWPCRLAYYGDTVTQNLAASFVYKLAQLEEGRRYLKFTSKVTIDIKKVLRKRGSKLDIDTVELLNAALKVMHPPMTQHVNGIYHYRHLDEGKIIKKFSIETQSNPSQRDVSSNIEVNIGDLTKRKKIVPMYTD
ncbi:uncharacterized protein LOC111357565 isoform X3 [Spodoptera litura]|uniref:Uncharacterized protein LOC111357565 isoform X3 n=1 Tax=Spodoptera litura TaxID=69820 RepID=A0A9J7EHG3_SPOLT|nr:uncharacterized protein LOC111357565 isoform X3 [Spodoptera litura]